VVAFITDNIILAFILLGLTDESKTRFITRHTMEGRAPLRVGGTRLITVARGGNNLRLHDASPETQFKQLHEIKVNRSGTYTF
jgi:hypothetical protein